MHLRYTTFNKKKKKIEKLISIALLKTKFSSSKNHHGCGTLSSTKNSHI